MAPSILTPGDIAIVGYITNGSPDSFSFVNLAPIDAGTVIYFTDNGWTGTGFRGSSATDGDGNENLIRFTAVNDIAAGTVIRSTDTSANFTWTKSGAIGTTSSGSYNDLSLSQSAEQIAAFQSSNPTNPLNAGITALFQIDDTGTFENATDSGTGNVIPGLSQAGNTAVLFNNTATYAAFNLNALSTSTKEQWLAAINNSANWTFSNLTTLPTGSIPIAGGITTPNVNLSVSSNTGSEENLTIVTVTATASSAVTGDQSVTVAVNGLGITTGDYTLSNNVITIANGATTGSVTFTVVDDVLVEGTETATLSISNPSSGIILGSTTALNITIADNDVVVAPTVRIHDIQGATHLSPLNGQAVQNVQGIVTAIASNGFYIQDPTPDANDATSEGIFVFTTNAAILGARTVGEAVLVSGTVSEFRPGGSANNLTVTEIVNNSGVQALSVSAWTNPPTTAIAPTVLGNGGRVIPTSVIENDATNVENNGIFDPTQDGIDFYESLEGMLVQVNNPVTTSPTAKFVTSVPSVTSEEIWVLADNGTNATSLTSKGGSLITSSDFNPERIQIDDLNNSLVLPDVNVGAQLSSVTGVVNYDFNNYEVLVSTAPAVMQPSTLQKEVTNLTSSATQLTVATFNVENLDPSDTTFNALASAIVSNMKSPDIINLEEIQDNNGATNDGTVDASVTLQTLINAIAATGGPTYEYRQINPVNNQDGGEPGGNIRVAFLFNPNRVSFVEGSLQRLTDANLADGDAFASSRKPLVGKFVFNQQEVTVIGNHFNSKGGDQPLFGPNQPPTLNSEVQRNQQATIVKDYVQGLLATNPNANIVVAGDLNDFEFSNPLSTLESGGLNTLIETLPANERYTYNFQGNAQALDQILVSNNLSSKLDGFDVVHINSEFADQVSDHDPSVARFNLPSPNQASYTLQLLHYYGESGLLGVETAPIMGALIDKFDDQYSNTLVIGEGDSYIPGPWLVGGSDPSLNVVPGIGSTALGRPDIAIMNAFGTDVSALGNHEFDLGSPVLQSAIAPSGAWTGAQFPLITSNLNFSADSSLRGLADASLGGTATNAFAGKEASTIKGKIAPYTVVTQGGEKIGIVGATTYDLLSKTSPNGTVPKDDGIPSTDDLQEVAAYIQASVDALKALGINKIVMVDQLDTIDRNKALAPLVSGIDVMVAGGGHERLGDANDTAVGFNGHSANFVDTYPIVTAGSDGKPTLIVTTDTEYSYLGRLVVDFNANGEIILPNLNPIINGAYASTEANLQAAYGTTQTAAQIVASSAIGSNVNAITQAINNVIISKDSNIFGYTNVYLEGDRAFGRAQEVNLGDITADANLFKAKQALGNGAVLASLKNGGGIRASIGSIDEVTFAKVAPEANPTANKPAGAISQLDIENALRFDNKLMVFDTTPQGLLNILNYAAGLAPGNGGYAQIGGVRFSYDPSKATGQKVQDVAIYDLDGNLVAKVADNGVALAGAPAKISVAVLNFTANGGDGYPIKANADNFRYLLNDGTLSAPIDKSLDFTAVANVPANTLGEQKAFQDFLQAFYSTPQTAYSVADTAASQDLRIQNLNERADTVLGAVVNGASLVSTITVAGNATDLFPTNGGNGGANINRLGGFGSDFFYDYRTGFYYGLADRGPGGGTIPYQTRVEKISLTVDPTTGAASNFQVVQTIPFYIPAGTTLNGVTYTIDTPFNGLNSKLLPDGGNGSLLASSQDPEGFVVGANGNFFVSDEYGPSIYEFEPTGKFVRAFTPPANVLPKVNGAPYYAGDVSSTTGRQDNRGYEGLAISPDGTKLFAVFQDPLQEEGSGGSNPGRSSRNVRIVRYDVATGLSDAQYIYQLESLVDINNRIPGSSNDFGTTAQGRNIGVSSLVAINSNELLVLERDNRGIGVDPASNLPIGSKLVYKIDLTGATNVSGISLAGTNTLPAGVTPVSKTAFLDIAGELKAAGQTVPEKIEGLAIGPQLADGSFALLIATDNDFSVTQNGSGTQLDVYTDGTQQAIDSAPPTSGATLLPSYVYSFKTQAGALNVTPVFDFSTNNYSVAEGNNPNVSTNATVRVTRRGDVSGTNSVVLNLTDGTATGGVIPTQAITKGVSSSATPYLIPVTSGVNLTSILTVGDSINGYKMVGIPDGLGTFDNGNGTFTLLMNHELGSTSGVVRAHGGTGAFISSWVINKSDLSVVSGGDLIQNVYNWDTANQKSNTTTSTINFNRFCSADLPSVTAFYNPTTGLGTQERIFMDGEEGGATGYQLATIATGAHKGDTYILGKFDLSTNGSGLTGVGAWENALANPFAQDKTIVIGNNDGGTGIMNNAVAVYVGTKTNTGTEIDKAGLTNGTLKFINVSGNAVEIANATTRATNITSGTAFTLSGMASTTFSRPEDGAWNPLDPSQYFFVTTDRLDQVADGVGTQVGRSRLWRLNFTDITNPDLGGTIDLLLDGTEGGNMFDNMAVDKYGHILLLEDVGNAAHNGKVWQYDIATDSLKMLAKHDPARFGDIGVSPTAPFTQDEEASGIIDAQDILGPGWFFVDTQAHYTITGELVEGGQLQALFNPDTYNSAVDYNNKPITVTFAPGETYKDVQIPIVGDIHPESDETVNLSLVNPSAGIVGTKQPTAVLTIANDDINSAPVLTGSKAILVGGKEDTAYTIALPSLLTGFTDANNDVLSVAGLTATNGTLTNNGNGTYSFVPNTNFNGTVNLSYNVIDGKGGITPATQSFAIAAVNDAPILTAGSLTRKVSGNLSQPITGISISDIDAGETLNATVQVTLTAGKGVLTLGATTGSTGTTTGSNITFSGAIADINAALATLTYKGNPNILGLGADTINLTVNDLGNTGSGGSLTDSKAIALNIYNTQNGTSGDNIFAATPYPDEILAGDGSDRVIADIFNLQQNDILDGGTGSDRLTIFGGTSTDNLTLNISDTGVDLLAGLLGLSGTTINNFESFDFSNFLGSLAATGSSQADEIIGGFGNDILDGGAGNDKLKGGLGDDRYIVDSTGDLVTELANEGIDTVQSNVNWTLGNNLENLTLTGNAISGTGNSLNNIMIGNNLDNTLSGGSGNDILDGGLGADSLNGGSGNDTYIVDNINDAITDSSGTDTVLSSIDWTLGSNLENLTLTGTGDINGTGNSLKNAIAGNSGNNILNGGSGADTLIGGAGNDTYIVDNTGDVVTELANEGTDTILSSVTRTLDANVENLTLTGTSSISGIGNNLDNTIVGNNGNNTLDGGVGVDTLIGGLGNDTYIVDNLGDTIVEGLNQGTDLVKASVSWTLVDNLENLTLTGSSDINGTGNSVNNVITGNNGNNILSGGFGNDTLTGGLGADTLVGGNGNDTLNLGLNDGAVDRVVYNLGDGSDSVNQFIRGLGGDLLQFNGIAAVDVRTVNGNTQFRLGDGVAGNAGFGNGSLLLTLNGVNGFTAGNINDNVLAGSIPTVFQFS
ncbi:esterase-like activity of phytase family protein [Tumidithrix elongata RA019]|uniref:Esterase-like activity of phytase family protein n=1 Tax=Tumidithrix elongata BACA0141 TaxID=2716417 RepID=A0AAW9PX21_9CYAN|nr:esterase-like activity of phytase family protein [Tumidithrix elongata RA019]